jgi:nickel/cobalt exporter
MRRTLFVVILTGAWTLPARAHDIPNAQVDRSIQATLSHGKLSIDYEIDLSELTLIQDLRALTGPLPGADRREWFDAYGRISGPLNAKGLLVSVDGRPVVLRSTAVDWSVENHIRYKFQFVSDLPPTGRLAIKDTNYASGEGRSRLALRGTGGVAIRANDLPEDVTQIPLVPVWQLDDVQERRTRQLEAEFDSGGPYPDETAALAPINQARKSSRNGIAAEGLSRLMDRSSASGMGLWLIALALGAAHAIQPGHGKSLVAATSIGDRGGWRRGMILALIITVAHMGGVLAIAAALWGTHSSRYPDINLGLARTAGFVIAAIGLWRLGRHLGGHGEHDVEDRQERPTELGNRDLIGLGLAGGIVPCWDAVVLILLAEAVGRVALGLALLTAFSLGMASVLVVVGVMAGRLQSLIQRRQSGDDWVRRLGLLSACTITMIGLYLFI